MTDVGKISLGVEIDASDLTAKLGEAVRRAIAPALQEIQRELQKTQREYDKTSRAAAKASAAQAESANIAQRAIHGVGEEHVKTGAKAQTSSGISTRAINSVTRAIEKQTAALAANSAARAANAAAPVGGPVGGGGGSAGGGGPPVDRHRGGFMQGGKGRFGFLTSPVGMNAVALGLGSLPAAATAITSVVGGLQQLSQAGLALPGIYGTAGASIGVAVAGFKGMGDAVKALNEAAKSGDPKDLEKATEAMKDMDPAAQAVAKSVSTLSRGPLLDLKKQIQGRMFRDFAGDLDNTANKAIPRLSGGILGIADAWNGTLRQLTGSLGQDRNLGLIDKLLGNTGEGQKRMNAAIDPLMHAVLTLTSASSGVIPRLADGLAAGAERFDRFITHAVESGQFDKWLNDGITGVHQLAESGLNVVKIITDITKAAGADQGGFLKWLGDATGKLRALTSSASGQNSMRKFFEEGREQLSEWGPILVNIGKMLIEVYEASRTWTNILLPFLRVATDLLTSMPGLVTAVGVALLAWKTASIFKPILGGLDKMIGKLQTVATTADLALGNTQAGGRGIAGRMGTMQRGVQRLGGARGTLGIGGIAAGAATQATSDSTGGQIAGALTTVASGALAGSVFGPVGTAVGAGVGAGIAGVTYLLSENAKASNEAADAAQRSAAAETARHDAFMASQGAIKTANDALLESGGVIDPAVIGAVGDQITELPNKLGLPEDQIKKVAEAMGGLNMTTEQLATTVTGGEPQFAALRDRLLNMGEPGRILAENLGLIRDNTLGAASNAAIATPALQALQEHFGGIAQAGVAVANAFAAVPHDVPITVGMEGVPAVEDILTRLGVKIEHNRDGQIIVPPLDDTVLRQLEAMGVQIERNRDGTIHVGIPPGEVERTLAQLGDLGKMYRDMFAGTPALPNVPRPPAPPPPISSGMPFAGFPQPGGADGMVIPGYAPGHDIVNAVLAPGEGVLIPEAVRGLGGPAGVYGINSRFRRGLSTRFYADGGVNPDGTPIIPGVDTELSVLIQIRDLLAGKGGTASNPLAATAANTATSATAAKTAGDAGTEIGPFGTPLKKKTDPAYGAAKGFLDALGFDSETIIGSDPTTYVPPTAATTAGLPGSAGVPVDMSGSSAALAKFAASGNLADLAGTGLNANDSVVKAIVNARNKKKGGLDDAAIGDLVTTTLGPGFTGVMDETNTPLVSALQTYREKLMKGSTTPASTRTTANNLPGVSPASADAMGLIAFAQQASGGAYSWGASDLAGGLSDCSGAVSDLVEIITKGAASPERLFSTGDAADVLTKLGAVPGAVPGALQIGWSDSHMRSTLPNGVNFESGGGTGQGATYGGNAQGAAGMPNIMSLPVGGAIPAGYGLPGMSGLGGLGGGAGGSGTPVYVTNWPGGGGAGGQLPGFLKNIMGAGIDAAGGAAGTVAGDVLGAVGGLGQEDWATAKNAPDADFGKLVRERNPMALAAALGFNVQDFTRQGGAGGEVETNDQKFDASGRMFSDTGALMDRTLTSLNQQLQAMREQLVDVITQVQKKLESEALEPVVKAGIQSALGTLKESISGAIGAAMGTAAAPPIADAVSSAVASLPIDQSGAGGVGGNAAGALGGVTAGLFASGGPVSGGQAGKDSVPAMLMPGEWVLNREDVARMGGFGGVQRITSKGLRHFATGGGVIGNDVVGAEFFGVSEVPIIGAIVNLLVRVLLQVIGVEIEVRDTLNEMTDDFRSFRGDAFKAFDAQGRLINDTSGLIDRSLSSEETAAQERIRILKIVIQAIIKYLIEKVIVPITKAVANAVIQAGSSAAGAAVSGAGGGPAGGIVSSVISSAGQAGVEIAAEVGTDFALAISEQLIAATFEGLQSQFPDLMTGLFSGAGAAQLFNPLGGFLTTILGGFMGAFAALLGGGVLGGASTLIPGIPFDEGGMAHGVGYLPKATAEPELVLSPGETDLFSRFVGALERGGFGGKNQTSVHAPITVIGGGRETAEQVESRLLKLMP